MSKLFVQPQNQELLWNVINQTPQMRTFFKDAAYGTREKWFQQIIQHIYSTSSPDTSLKVLNKTAIQTMLDLLSIANNNVISQQPQPLQQPQQQPQPLQPELPFTDKKTEVNKLYEARLKEYQPDKPAQPLQLQMTKIADDAILDIETAVNDYIKNRDKDLIIHPPPPQQQSHQQQQQQSQQQPPHQHPIKKSVSWEDDNPLLIKIIDKLNILEDKLNIMQKHLEQFTQQNINADCN